jgi:NADH:ubiquinone oxidoreductase subunit 6 (subunit J)
MLLNIRVIEIKDSRSLPLFFIALIFGLIEVALMVTQREVHASYQNVIQLLYQSSNELVVFQLLYNVYYVWFVLAGILLLVSMISAIVLTINREVRKNKTDMYQQIIRELAIILQK